MDTSLLSPLIDSPLFGLLTAVLITEADLAHCGALPFLVKKWKYKFINVSFPPVFATEAVKRLAEIVVCEFHEQVDAVKNVTTLDELWTLKIEDVVLAFQAVHGLQWGEEVKLLPPISPQEDMNGKSGVAGGFVASSGSLVLLPLNSG